MCAPDVTLGVLYVCHAKSRVVVRASREETRSPAPDVYLPPRREKSGRAERRRQRQLEDGERAGYVVGPIVGLGQRRASGAGCPSNCRA